MVTGVDMLNDCTETINYNKAFPRWRGFRQLLNYDETAPIKSVDLTVKKNVWEDQIVRDNLKRMEEVGCTYDLMMEPNQYPAIFEALETVPNLKVIVDHRGCRLARPFNLEFIQSQEYLDAMKKFASMPNVFMKISMFGWSDPKWENGDAIVEETIKLIKLFGPQRCMFGTNFPIDCNANMGGWTMKGFVEVFDKICKEFTPEE